MIQIEFHKSRLNALAVCPYGCSKCQFDAYFLVFGTLNDVKRSAKRSAAVLIWISQISIKVRPPRADNIFKFKFYKLCRESTEWQWNTLLKRIISDKKCCHRLCSQWIITPFYDMLRTKTFFSHLLKPFAFFVLPVKNKVVGSFWKFA